MIKKIFSLFSEVADRIHPLCPSTSRTRIVCRQTEFEFQTRRIFKNGIAATAPCIKS